MRSYRCEHCGAFLDPGERCDCEEERESKEMEIERMLDFSEDQIRFKLPERSIA